VELLSLFLYAPFSSLPPEKIFEEADSLINLSKDFEMKEILNSLKLLWQELERRGMTEYIFFDLGKLPKWGEYYSSLIFEVLTKNKNPLCSGGRYDKLYQEFLNDEDAGGCGCAFYINSIIQKKC
jgi:ATP phosphoribosyltransferase regulatory subunit